MQEKNRLLRNIPIFSSVPEDELAPLVSRLKFRTLNKREIVFTEGSPRTYVYFIHSGCVKTYKTDADGHEQIIHFLQKGEWFPHNGLFGHRPYPATAEAIQRTELSALPIRAFEEWLIQRPKQMMELLRTLGDKIQSLTEKMLILSMHETEQRLISVLIQLAQTHGDMRKSGWRIPLPLTHRELAHSVGTSRETINRMMRKLQKEGIVAMNRKECIILDPARLLDRRNRFGADKRHG
jgi:CRP/FNR family cyclic AMP-dependent transcriptional regulator